MVKKAFLKTIEILLVIVITTIFLIAVLQKQTLQPTNLKNSYLINLMQNQDFRTFVTGNSGCFNTTSFNISSIIRSYLPNKNSYIFCINDKAASLPKTDVVVDTIFISGNYSELSFKTVRLYYWLG